MRTHERRERIVQIIAMCGTVTAKELATRLRVTPRTILRDIDALSMLYPISVNYCFIVIVAIIDLFHSKKRIQ